MANMAASSCRQKYHAETEEALNKQINMELFASHTYLMLASYYDRDNVALKGFYEFFKKQSDEEREHATKMIEYQNLRGGRVALTGITSSLPSETNYNTPLGALRYALYLEKQVNESLLALHALASGHNDAQFCDFIESEFLKEQVESMKEIADKITNLERVGEGLGTYIFDRDLKS